MTSSSTREQVNQVGARVSDHEPNTAVVEIRLTRDEEIVHAHNQGVQVPLLMEDFPLLALIQKSLQKEPLCLMSCYNWMDQLRSVHKGDNHCL